MATPKTPSNTGNRFKQQKPGEKDAQCASHENELPFVCLEDRVQETFESIRWQGTHLGTKGVVEVKSLLRQKDFVRMHKPSEDRAPPRWRKVQVRPYTVGGPPRHASRWPLCGQNRASTRASELKNFHLISGYSLNPIETLTKGKAGPAKLSAAFGRKSSQGQRSKNECSEKLVPLPHVCR